MPQDSDVQTQDTKFTRNMQKTFNPEHLIQNATENEAIKKRTKIKTNTENQDRKKKTILPNYKQSEKEKDHMIPLTRRILKNDTNELTKQKQTHRLGK